MNNANINGAGIREGDYVVAKPQTFYEDGDYVIATFEGRANVKKFIRYDDYVALISESYDKIPPIFIGEGEVEKLAVHGKVIKVLRATVNEF